MADKKPVDPATAFYCSHEIKNHAKQTYEMDKRLAREFDIKQVNERNNPFSYKTHRKAYKEWQTAYLNLLFNKDKK